MTFEATKKHDNRGSDITIRATHTHGPEDSDWDSVSDAALMFEHELDSYVSTITKTLLFSQSQCCSELNPGNLHESLTSAVLSAPMNYLKKQLLDKLLRHTK